MADREEWKKRIRWSVSIDCWKDELDVFASLWVEGYFTSEETLEELATLRREVTNMAIDMIPDRPNDQHIRRDVITALSEITMLENACRDPQAQVGSWAKWEAMRKQARGQGRELPPIH